MHFTIRNLILLVVMPLFIATSGCVKDVSGLAKSVNDRSIAESRLAKLGKARVDVKSPELTKVRADYDDLSELVNTWLTTIGGDYVVPLNFKPLNVSDNDFSKQFGAKFNTLQDDLQKALSKNGIASDFSILKFEDLEKAAEDAYNRYEKLRNDVKTNMIDSAKWLPFEDVYSGKRSPNWPLPFVTTQPSTGSTH
jgi:hypothetical protein